MVKYFRHFVNERRSLTLRSFIGQYGAKGYGVFWAVLEEIYSSPIRTVVLEKSFYKKISKEMKVRTPLLKRMIKDMHNYGLMEIRNNVLTSERAKREVKDIKAATARRTKEKKNVHTKQSDTQVPIRGEHSNI